jgi:beta-xylosidase
MGTMVKKNPAVPYYGSTNRLRILIIALSICLILTVSENQVVTNTVLAKSDECETLGWFPEDFGLKDHSVFTYNGYYYIVSINVPVEEYFAYARSSDLCHWEDLSPVLSNGVGEWDTVAIWAPDVFLHDGTYYMYYTGVKGSYPNLTQSILLATTTNPADPDSWETKLDFVFQPDHHDMVWEDSSWADCRDPMVERVGDTFYMYYTGKDSTGGIVGLATAESPSGPWMDTGSILSIDQGEMAESPIVWEANGGFYLFYNRLSNSRPQGEVYHFGPSPMGPWNDATLIHPGWAHEIWLGMDGRTYTSYLTDYSISIQPLIFNHIFQPPRPLIGDQINEFFLPIIIND